MGERVRMMKGNIHETENYAWGVLQDMIEREISAAFKIRTPLNEMPTKKEIKQIIKKTVHERRK
jgi:hypothetical protein